MPHSPRPRSTDSPTPPLPSRLRWWSRLGCHWAGRRDARARLEPDSEGHTAYTRQRHGAVQEAVAAVGCWMNGQLGDLDRDIAALAGRVADGRRNLLETADALAQLPGDPGGARLDLADVDLLRRRRAQHARGDAARVSIEGAAAQLRAALEQRRHAIDAARHAVEAWSARYEILTRAYLRGMHRKRRGVVSRVGYPAYRPELTWVDGDIPLVVALTDPGTAEAMDWAVREFRVPALRVAR